MNDKTHVKHNLLRAYSALSLDVFQNVFDISNNCKEKKDKSALTCIVYTVDRILKNPKISDFLSVSTILHTVNNSWVKNVV